MGSGEIPDRNYINWNMADWKTGGSDEVTFIGDHWFLFCEKWKSKDQEMG